MKKTLGIILLLLTVSPAAAFDLESNLAALADRAGSALEMTAEPSQAGGKSLSQAVDSVRRRGNVERIVSAQTRVEGGREVHYIRYMTKDGKVRTEKVNGRRRG